MVSKLHDTLVCRFFFVFVLKQIKRKSSNILPPPFNFRLVRIFIRFFMLCCAVLCGRPGPNRLLVALSVCQAMTKAICQNKSKDSDYMKHGNNLISELTFELLGSRFLLLIFAFTRKQQSKTALTQHSSENVC